MRVGRNYKIGIGSVITPPGGSAVVKLRVSNVTNPVIDKAKFKYNKDVGFMLGMDDNYHRQITHVLPLFNGGLSSNGTTYPGLKYSDGTGKMISYRAMLVMICGLVGETNAANNLQYAWPNVRAALNAHWGISNHTTWHGDLAKRAWDSYKQMKDGDQIVFDKTGYKIIINTTPASEPGYQYTGKVIGKLCHNSTANEGNARQTIYNNGSPEQIEAKMDLETNGWFILDRQSFDSNDSLEQHFQDNKAYIDQIFDKADNGAKCLGNWLTHGPTSTEDCANFDRIYNYIQNHPKNTGIGRVWVAGTHEVVSYLQVKRTTNVTHSVSGDVLTLTIDMSNVNPDIQDRDLTLLTSGFNITELIDKGSLDDVTFNPTNGLVNLYKRESGFLINPSDQPKPSELLTAIRNGTAIDLTYSKPITQTMIEAYTVSGRTVTGISGSGTSWKLQLNSAASISDTLSYRMYNNTETLKGNAVTVDNNMRVCDYINTPLT